MSSRSSPTAPPSAGPHRRRAWPTGRPRTSAPARFGLLLTITHSLDTGAQRLVEGTTDPALRSGVFYASAANALTGPVVDQADISPDLANPAFRDNADEAIHRFIAAGGTVW